VAPEAKPTDSTVTQDETVSSGVLTEGSSPGTTATGDQR
jgi:hypothetical protein